jgi:hypothetical protein
VHGLFNKEKMEKKHPYELFTEDLTVFCKISNIPLNLNKIYDVASDTYRLYGCYPVTGVRINKGFTFYHTLEHVNRGRLMIPQIFNWLAQPEEFILAWYWHDIIYIPGSSVNEKASSDIAKLYLEYLGAPKKVLSI